MNAPAAPAAPAEAEPGLPLLAVVGATATGKSDLAIDLAERLDGEVVNADALQLYRGMDIGTAKVTAQERRGIPHHLLDVLDVTEEASVSAYQRAAREAIAGIRSRGRVPILVGGSGLYVRAALDDIEFPPTDPDLRARLEERARREGTEALHRELSASDPEALARSVSTTPAASCAPSGRGLTGKPFAAFTPSPPRPLDRAAGAAADRAVLHERIALRVEADGPAGPAGGDPRPARTGLDRGRTARRAIGYEQDSPCSRGG